MRTNVKSMQRWLKLVLVAMIACTLAGCDDPQVYGSVGISSGYGGYGGYGGGYGSPRMHGSISVGGRIR